MNQAEGIETAWDEVCHHAADLHAAHSRLVSFMIDVLAEDSWCSAGIRSPEHFLVLRAGLSRGQATAITLIARRSSDLPRTTATFLSGRISLDQAAVVARHTPPEFDETLAEFAQHATVPQLQRAVSRYDFTLEDHDAEEPQGGSASAPDDGSGDVSDQAAGDAPQDDCEDDCEDGCGDSCAGAETPPPPCEAAPTLSMWNDENGRFHLRYEAPEDIGALVEAAIAEAKDWLFQHGVTKATHADALAVIANRSLDSVTIGSRRARYRVNVFLDTQGGWLLGQHRLPQHLIEALTCDGELVPIWETEGRPVNVGRRKRTVPERVRRLVLDRDRGCRYPGCAATAHLEVHHKKHWSKGGLTNLDNLLCLCTFHHDAHHRGEFLIKGDPTRLNGLRFLTPQHWPIEPGTIGDPHHHRDSTHDRLTLVPDLDPDPDHDPGHDPDPVKRDRTPYQAPKGDPLHLHLVDFTPPGHHTPRSGPAEAAYLPDDSHTTDASA